MTLKERKAAYYRRNRKHILVLSSRRYWENRDAIVKQSKKRYKRDRNKILSAIRTPEGKYRVLSSFLRKEKIEKTDPLWSKNFYTALIIGAVCHYCDGPLNKTGHSLDAKDNSQGHRGFNIVPCCHLCNQKKMDDVNYEEMLEIREWLVSLRIRREKENGLPLHK